MAQTGPRAAGNLPLPLIEQNIACGPAFSPRLDALSVDVEDYYHVEAFRNRIAPQTWPAYPSRVVANTRRVLELLSRHGARATFFVLGWVAERYPKIVREILSAGHEIGCHSYGHECVWRLSPEQFRADTRRARLAVEDAGGRAVLGYRAPSFSIVERTLWAVPILAEEGFRYDSSVFPIRHDVYGFPQAPRFPFRWATPQGHRLYEIPPTTLQLAGWNLPAAGGGYLRILPEWYTRWAFRRARRQAQSMILYFHPWEIDPGQPRLPGSFRSRLRHYSGLERMNGKLERVLASGTFVPLIDCLNSWVGEAGRQSPELTEAREIPSNGQGCPNPSLAPSAPVVAPGRQNPQDAFSACKAGHLP